MDKFLELLKNAGIADTDAFIKAMKDAKIHLSNEENIDVRYGKLKTDHDGVKKQLDEANKIIETLKASQTASEADKAKITEYETNVAKLNEQLKQAKLESAIKIALLSAKATDVDYMMFKLKEKGGNLELDENGNVKGIDDKLTELKTQFPSQFEGTTENGTDKKFVEKRITNEEGGEKYTRADVLKMSYQKRAELYRKDPEAYEDIMHESN